MASSKSNPKRVFCRIRKEAYSATPEELVRQGILNQMIDHLGYPQSSIVVEKSLRQMPHLTNSLLKLPNRRFDLICFAKGIHPDFDLYPLLLLECKAVALNSEAVTQLIGYNAYLKSYYIGLVNQEEIRTGWFDSKAKNYHFISGIPSYSDLIEFLSHSNSTS